MWAIGWRKSQDFLQIIGRYIKKFKPGQMEKYKNHFQQSHRAGKIMGNYFQQMGHIPFSKNQSIMEKFNIPSFASLRYGE
jgi:hypothetical protein